MSNALLVGRNRSTNGHPLFVADPQVGHFYPQILLELDLRGGIDARGAAFRISVLRAPRSRQGLRMEPHVVDVGIVDEYVEELCGDDTHYRYQGSLPRDGELRRRHPQGRVRRAGPAPALPHDGARPGARVATVDGRRVAIARKRSTRWTRAAPGLAWQDLNMPRNRGGCSPRRPAGRAVVQLGLRRRPRHRDVLKRTAPHSPGTVDPGCRRSGAATSNGAASCRSLGIRRRPASGTIHPELNKPAPGFAAADDQWSYGVGAARRPAPRRSHATAKRTLATVVSAMNAAGTQDLARSRSGRRSRRSSSRDRSSSRQAVARARRRMACAGLEPARP